MAGRHLRALQRLADRAGTPYRSSLEPANGGQEPTRGPIICLYRDGDPEGSGDVPDPWYGGHQDFLDTLEVIERVTPRLLSLVSEAGLRS